MSGTSSADVITMDIKKIQSLLLHRFPFLLIDRVTECIPGERLVGYKNVSINEPFFAGHFPDHPVMPGVLVIEALAQATGLLSMETAPNDLESIYYLVGVDRARFKRTVSPGDQLNLEVSLIKCRRGIWVYDSIARVDDQVVATAEIMCTERVIET